MRTTTVTIYLGLIAFCMAGIVGIFAISAISPQQPALKIETVAPPTSSAVLPSPVAQQATTTTTAASKPHKLASAPKTTEKFPAPLTAAQEATIEAGLNGDAGQYCPDVCEPIKGETEGMSEDNPVQTTIAFETPIG